MIETERPALDNHQPPLLEGVRGPLNLVHERLAAVRHELRQCYEELGSPEARRQYCQAIADAAEVLAGDCRMYAELAQPTEEIAMIWENDRFVGPGMGRRSADGYEVTVPTPDGYDVTVFLKGGVRS